MPFPTEQLQVWLPLSYVCRTLLTPTMFHLVFVVARCYSFQNMILFLTYCLGWGGGRQFLRLLHDFLPYNSSYPTGQGINGRVLPTTRCMLFNSLCGDQEMITSSVKVSSGLSGPHMNQSLAPIPCINLTPYVPTLKGKAWWCFEFLDISVISDHDFNNPKKLWPFLFFQCLVPK